MQENAYADRYYEIMSSLNDPRVDGVHETKLPLIEKALISLSCIVKPRVAKLEEVYEATGAISSHKFLTEELDLVQDSSAYL
jgi:hypothetical protein